MRPYGEHSTPRDVASVENGNIEKIKWRMLERMSKNIEVMK